MRPVEEIEEGFCFRKKNGTLAYLRISESSVKFHGLDHETHIYGACYNGNITKVAKGTLVEPVDISVMDENRYAEEEWDRTFAGEEIGRWHGTQTRQSGIT